MKNETEVFTLGDLKSRQVEWIATGHEGFDRITGGGLVRNALTIYAGRTGSGKSTFLTQAAGTLTDRGMKVLYVSGEEDLSQFAFRATKRLRLENNVNFMVTDNTELEFLLQISSKFRVDVIMIDSLPMLHHSTGARVSVIELNDIKKTLNAAILFVQHENKGHKIAGTAKDQHFVDIILKADPEWDQPTVRRLKVEKNRFAPITHELRYTLTEYGVETVNIVPSDPFNDPTRPNKQTKTKTVKVKMVRG